MAISEIVLAAHGFQYQDGVCFRLIKTVTIVI